jgi:hypothetical protein
MSLTGSEITFIHNPKNKKTRHFSEKSPDFHQKPLKIPQFLAKTAQKHSKTPKTCPEQSLP